MPSGSAARPGAGGCALCRGPQPAQYLDSAARAGARGQYRFHGVAVECRPEPAAAGSRRRRCLRCASTPGPPATPAQHRHPRSTALTGGPGTGAGNRPGRPGCAARGRERPAGWRPGRGGSRRTRRGNHAATGRRAPRHAVADHRRSRAADARSAARCRHARSAGAQSGSAGLQRVAQRAVCGDQWPQV